MWRGCSHLRRLFYFFLGTTCSVGFISCFPTDNKEKIPDWSADIAPIVFSNCTPCHRPRQSGSFDLLTYRDAVKRAKQIKFVTGSRYMPPWPADPSYVHFLDERTLSDKEIVSIAKWVDGGCPRGDSVREPRAPHFESSSYFGKPDIVIRAPQPVQIKGNGTDVFLIMKYPYELPQDTVAAFFEFVPHQKKLVHHVNGHLLSYDDTRRFDYWSGAGILQDTQRTMSAVLRKMHIPYTDGALPDFPPFTPNVVYYLPGYVPPAYPDDVGGYRLKRHGVILVNNIHFGPSNTDMTDSSVINVFFRRGPVKRPIAEAQLGTFGLSPIEPALVIPPDTVMTFRTKYILPRTISLLSVNPHMHLIGKSFLAFAVTPEADTIRLVKIPKWDFRWQYYYTYPHPVKLTKGTAIYVYGTYDNTSKNPNNPFFPPRKITEGNGVESMKTTEEMFQFIFTYLDYKSGDEKIDLRRK